MNLVKGYKGFWYIKYQKNGKWTHKTTKQTSIRLAEKCLQEFLVQQSNPVPAPKTQITIQELINKFVEIHCNGDNSIAEIMKQRFCKLLVQYFGKDRTVNSLTSLDFEIYRKHRLNQKKFFDKTKTISPTTINIELRAYKALFNKAIKWELIEKNPLSKFTLCKVQKKNKQIINESEKDLLLRTIEHKGLKNIVIFTLLTGCRISEVLNLQWKNIDFTDNIINIIGKEDWNTKTGEIRQIPMSPELHAFLKEIYFSNNINSITFLNRYVFCKDTGYKFNLNYISRKFKFYVRKCKIDEYIHFHSLRHTAVTDLIRSGEPINKVKDFIGHKNIATTMGYTHLVIDDLRNTATKLSVANYK